MNFNLKIQKIIVNYVLKYHQKCRTLQISTSENMWSEITNQINTMCALKHKEAKSSTPCILVKSDNLRTYFKKFLIFQLKNNVFNLTEDEYFTVTYPYIDILKRLMVIFIANRKTIVNIDEDHLKMLNLIIQYHLNRYQFNRDIWDVFDKWYRIGVRKLEINIEHPYFRLTSEEKQLLLESSCLTRFATESNTLINSGCERCNVQNSIETEPNPDLENLSKPFMPETEQSLDLESEDINMVEIYTTIESRPPTEITEVNMEKDNQILEQRHLETFSDVHQISNLEHRGDIEEDSTSQLDVPIIESFDSTHIKTINLILTNVELTPKSKMSKDHEIELRPNVNNQANQVLALQPNEENFENHTSSNQNNNEQSNCAENMNVGELIGSQNVPKNGKFKSLVHWSLLFELYGNDVCLT